MLDNVTDNTDNVLFGNESTFDDNDFMNEHNFQYHFLLCFFNWIELYYQPEVWPGFKTD